MKPLVEARKRTPTSTALRSGSVRAGVAVLGQMVHGQPKELATVVNDQVSGSIWLPDGSRAPDRLAV